MSLQGRQFQFTAIDYSRSAITVETVAITCPAAGERQVSKYSGQMPPDGLTDRSGQPPTFSRRTRTAAASLKLLQTLAP